MFPCSNRRVNPDKINEVNLESVKDSLNTKKRELSAKTDLFSLFYIFL